MHNWKLCRSGVGKIESVFSHVSYCYSNILSLVNGATILHLWIENSPYYPHYTPLWVGPVSFPPKIPYLSWTDTASYLNNHEPVCSRLCTWRDLICMNNNKMRERIFRLNFSHTRPAELSIMHLQSESAFTTTFRKGCSIVGKSVICRCLEKLEVVLRCIYSLKRQLAIVWDLDETSCDFYVESLAVLQPTHGKYLIAKHLQSKWESIIAIGHEKCWLCASCLQPNLWPNKVGRFVKLSPRSVQHRQVLRSVPLYSPTLQVSDHYTVQLSQKDEFWPEKFCVLNFNTVSIFKQNLKSIPYYGNFGRSYIS